MSEDLISRQAAIDCVTVGAKPMTIRGRIAELPSAEPKRKKGTWIKMSDADGVYWACSECGENIPRVSDYDPQFNLFPRLKSIKKTNFCANCGAEMRGEDDAEVR